MIKVILVRFAAHTADKIDQGLAGISLSIYIHNHEKAVAAAWRPDF